MQVLYGARFARPDLLRAVAALARKITKWTHMCDLQLHRLMSYVNSSLDYKQYAWVGDPIGDLQVHLFTDADLASDPSDSASTSSAFFALVGPHSFAPIAQRW